ncbi:hypothetical protein BVG16_10380 [Paenibacillus selenitireducens]|uniref:HTH tetR-type domain-containing protein n=2 Tax=Paenibacillus selenitireducens TaxID=1324314 RepID=A0A1T2XID0_9BACL|nr:hypothetical protein BVG16_10380 [Paenibacillus selenitireducens]
MHILEAAMKCFAQKGYHATSMQEIADSLKIAKGSLYFYFKSKEDVLVSAFKHYHGLMAHEIMIIAKDLRLSPRERLMKQFTLQMEQFMKHQDFIVMMLNEQAFQINEDMKRFMFTSKAEALYWYYNSILAIYGSDVEEYALDAATMIQAISGDYIGYMIFHRKKFDTEHLSTFFMHRLDDLVHGLIEKQQAPILSMDNMGAFMKCGKEGFDHEMTQVERELIALGQEIAELDTEVKIVEEITSCYQVLQQEWAKPEPQPMILKGLLAYLRSFRRPTLSKSLDVLESEI